MADVSWRARVEYELVSSDSLVLELRNDGTVWLHDAGDDEDAWENCIEIRRRDLETIKTALVSKTLDLLFGPEMMTR